MGRQIDRIDGLSSSTAIKGPARVATTANITLSDLQTIDGVALADGDRVLVRAQTDAKLNGIYRVSTGLWQRTKDFSSNRDVRKGTRIVVTDGITYATSEWIVTAANPVVFDTSEITFSQIFFSTGSDVTITGVGVIVKETLADLNTVTPTDENFGGRVLDDPDPANNGDYYRQASAWVKGADLQRYNLSRLTITGGTVNAIEATTDEGVNPYSAVGFFIDIPDGDENTDDVTIAINGGAALPIYQHDGTQFPAGAFAGRQFLTNEDVSLKSLDPNTTFIQQLAAIATQLEAVGDNISAILAVDGNKTNIDIVAGSITNVNGVGNNIVAVVAAGENSDNITAVAENEVNINEAVENLTDLAAKLNKDGSNVGDSTAQEAFREAIGATDWASQPIGVPIPLMSHLNGVSVPPTDQVYRYILLTAGEDGVGGYNEGVLTGESVSGTAPRIDATAIVDDDGGPLDGETINLINTERRFLRAGEPGTVQRDEFESHRHSISISDQPINAGTGGHGNTEPGGSMNTNFAGDNETRPRNIGVEYYMRIR